MSVVNKVETHLARGTLLAFIFCAACSTPKPIVVSNEVFPKDLASVNRELTPAESERVINAMASTRQQKDIDGARPVVGGVSSCNFRSQGNRNGCHL